MNRIFQLFHNTYFRYPLLRKLRWFFVGIIFSLLLVYIYWPSPLETYPVGWEKSFYISPPYVESKNPHISRRGNIIAVAYEGKEIEKREIQHYVYLSLSLNGGKSYLPPLKVAKVSGTIDHNPVAAISSTGHIAVVWQNIVPPQSNSRLFYSLSTNMGASWSDPLEIGIVRDELTDSEMDMLPLIEYDDKNQLHLFYHGVRGDMFNLFHSISNDGKAFSPPRKLVDVAEGLRGAFFPAVRFRGSNIFIVWQGRRFAVKQFTDDLFFLKSDNYGASFSRSRPITFGIGSSASPSLEVKENTVYVVYQNNKEKTWGIWLSVSKNGGETWEPPLKISDTNANCYAPSIAQTASDELIIIWYDLRGRYPALFSRKMMLDPPMLKPSVMISRPNAAAIAPAVVSVEKKVIVAWREGGRILTNYSDVYVAPPIVTSPTHPEDRWSRA
ncbi:MAG: glycoside hydrolase, partial [Spirochaetes bacterium]|nr:glycoside hydrolase [Spirochaetota bacterium]